jgi:putative oxidoreductase
METVDKWNRWANAHTNPFLDVLRILFGAFIMFKGVFFLDQTDHLYNLFANVGGQGTYFILVHYVALSHLVGGFFITLGLLTRWCSLVQLPILLGAVSLYFFGNMSTPEFLQAFVSLIICSFFVYYGSGRHSVDYSLKLHA